MAYGPSVAPAASDIRAALYPQPAPRGTVARGAADFASVSAPGSVEPDGSARTVRSMKGLVSRLAWTSRYRLAASGDMAIHATTRRRAVAVGSSNEERRKKFGEAHAARSRTLSHAID